MSQSLSRRAAPRDWAALLAQAQAADRQLTPEELDLWRRGIIDGTANGWHVDLVHALQRAIEGRDHAALLRWLDAGMPVPGFLSPVISDALRAMDQGTIRGRPRQLTVHDDEQIRWYFDKMTGGTLQTDAGTVRAKLAATFGVSTDTIRRALTRTA